MPMRPSNALLIPLIAAVISLGPSSPALERSSPRASADLGDLFAPGLYLQDRNGDGVVDFINARIVVPDKSTSKELAAAGNIAARLGFESSAFTPGIAMRDADITPGPDTAPLILIGRSNRLVAHLLEEKKLNWGALQPGQGAVALVKSPFGGADAVVVAGADEDGTLAAANALAARWPYLWQLRKNSVQSIERDVRAQLARSGIRVTSIYAPLAIYQRGRDEVRRLVLMVDVAPGSEAAAAAGLERLAAAHRIGTADFTDRRADALNYYDLETLEIRLSRGNAIQIERFGPPYRDNAPENPWTPRVKPIDLSSLYTAKGVLGSHGTAMIPDETDTVVIIGSQAGATLGAVELAARIALESTGVSLPLVIPESEVTDPSKLPNPILVGPGKLLASLGRRIEMPPGEGTVEIVSQAFGTFPAVLVTGGDPAGVNAAAMYLASHVPYLWEVRRGEVSLERIQDEVSDFFRGRSTAGQAAKATLELDDLLNSFKQKNIAIRSIDAKTFLEEDSPAFASFLQGRLKDRLGAAEIAATAASRYGPVTVFQDSPNLGWEVDDTRDRFRAEVLPQVKTGDKVQLEVLVSEPLSIRQDLEREFADALRQAGASQATVRVICAYKQGFSWLADYVLPALRGKSVVSVTVYFPTAQYPPGHKWYGLAIRWLQEIFPIDGVFARELGIDVDATRFQKTDDGPIVYRVEAKDRSGRTVYTDEFSPRFVDREYFPYKPTATIQYTTGGITARINGDKRVDLHVATDPERFWNYYQNTALPKMFDYARAYTGGNLGLTHQPFFRDLIFDITMSEPDARLNLDEERISSLDSLHEDLMFDTIDFWAIFSGKPPGSREVAPGRIMPIIHPVQPGKPPKVVITLKGNAVPTPRLVVTWRTADGSSGSRTVDLTNVAIDPPRATAVSVRSGAQSVSRLTVEVSGTTFEATSTAARMVERLGEIQRGGALKNALAYAKLDELAIVARSGDSVIAQRLVPQDRSLLPAAGMFPMVAREPGEPIVTWDHVIGPDELEQRIIPRLRAFPEINPYVVGRTYRGRNVWAMDVMLPLEATLWSQAKASTFKPVMFIQTRQHANEVSATSGHLRFMELLGTDPAYRKYLNRVNIVYNPMENPDGAANHQEFYELTPTYILHGGYWSSVGRDVGAYVWDPDPLLPEALVRRKIYDMWLPDIYMNPHGYPSHEWVQQFAGYKVPWFLWFWIPAGYHIDLENMNDPDYPEHRAVAAELRERIIEEVMSISSVRTINARLLHRYEKYARGNDPYAFSLEVYKGMDIIFNYGYSFEVGGLYSGETYIDSLWKHPNPHGEARTRGTFASFVVRRPEVTVLGVGCDMPDETASPEWMDNMAARGQFGYLTAMMKLLYDSHWKVQRVEDDFKPAVHLSFIRPRPIKSSRSDSGQN